MSQESSLTQSGHSVRQALTAYSNDDNPSAFHINGLSGAVENAGIVDFETFQAHRECQRSSHTLDFGL